MIERDDELDPRVLDALANALEPTAVPAPGLRARLFGTITGRERFLPFLDRLIALFDLPEEETRREVDAILDPDAEWEPMLDGCSFRDFEGGPALGDAHAGLIRLQPGAVFPSHRHVGEERILLLQGRVRDSEGNEYRAGDTIVSADGSAHDMLAIGDEEVIYAAVVVALEFSGE
ncbi:MAG: cupin domain-containing protein [Deltaproteobacteria bacterium]|nr:cupin domain-containing protein [Nannocystaceae bacterium]